MSLLTDRASVLREFFRLVNADSTDADLTEHDNSTLEGAYEALEFGLKQAQLLMISIGRGARWLREQKLTVIGAEPDKFAVLGKDFLRLDADPAQDRSGVHYSNKSRWWGTMIEPEDRLRARGNYFWVEDGPPQLVENRLFDDSTGWTLSGSGTGWSIADGKLKATGSGTTETATYTPEVAIVPGTVHTLRFTLTHVQAGGVTPTVGGVAGTRRSTSGTFVERITPTAATTLVLTQDATGGAFDGWIDDLELIGPDFGAVLRFARGAAVPAEATAQYYRKAHTLADDVDLDIPEDFRPLVPAFAAAYAMNQAWFPGSMEEKQAILSNLNTVTKDAYRRGRIASAARKVQVAPARGRYII